MHLELTEDCVSACVARIGNCLAKTEESKARDRDRGKPACILISSCYSMIVQVKLS